MNTQPAPLRALRNLVRFEAFDTTTEAGRAAERHRRVALSSLAGAAARAVTIGSGLLTVPLAVRYLGDERYGLFVTVASLAALVSWADFGIGNGVLTLVSSAHGRGDRDAARAAVSSGFLVLAGTAALLGLLFAVLYPVVPWADIFNVTTERAQDEAGPAVAVFVACTLAAMPLGVAQRAQLAFQEGFLASLWLAVGSLLALGALLLGSAVGAGLPWLIGAAAGGPAAALLLNALWLFGRQRRWLAPTRRAWKTATARTIVRTGALFLALQVAIAVAYESDALVVASVLGAAKVTVFAVSFKLFTIAPILLSFVFTPLWPAYAEAFAAGDEAWARRTLRRSLTLAVGVSVPLAILLVIAGAPIIHLWAGSDVTPSLGLRLALAIWAVLMSVGGALAMFLNGLGAMRFQALAALTMMVVNVALSITLTKLIGVSGVTWGSVLAQTLCVLLPTWLYLRARFEPVEPAAV
jgi:O-antigen/teichoic acid export membrane protein